MAGSSRCDAQLNNSSSSSTENDLPSSTCDWTKGLIDKLGLRYEYKLPSDMVIEHMSSVAHLFPEEINDLEKVASKLGTVGNLNHESLLQINLAGLRWLTQSDEDVGLLRTEVPFKEIDVLRYSTYVKKFGFSLWFVLKENPSAVSEAKYRCLFQEFLQMFGIQVMLKENAVLQTRMRDQQLQSSEGHKTPQKKSQSLRRKRVYQTGYYHNILVTFTRLFMKEDTMTEIQTSSRESLPLKEKERPILYYSRPYNYLLEEDREEIVKALLTLTVMEYRARGKKRR
ncbi:uncharacterized protein LOC125673662 isoform X3 [Ostrea edulis]|uniref:uncharacterized protein LOC125673662 isoform X3 n=1 Tax=Ostrea edulis TaxID=37623 RepID=UPI0024AFC892|nr:uncharacterized protein LOC125673662 isoform X3 [Ostrea edulis]